VGATLRPPAQRYFCGARRDRGQGGDDSGADFNTEEAQVPWSKPRPTTSVEAYDDLLRAGEYAVRFIKEDNLTARHWIQKAIALDPGYADAYVALAWNYNQRVLFGWSDNPGEDLNHSSELAQKALSLDDSESGALAILCGLHWLQRRFDQAISEGERAIALNPNWIGGYQALADALTAANRPAEAIRIVEKEMRLDPSHPDFYAYFIASPYVLMGRYEEAIPLLKRHLTAYPNQPWAHAVLIIADVELGRYQEARAQAAELKHISPQFLAHMAANKDEAVNERWRKDLRIAGVQ
jgi:adenylate cyclase